MKLILNVGIEENKNIDVVILDSDICEIDKFTTLFFDKNDLYNKIINVGPTFDCNFSKFKIFIRTNKGNILPVLYRDYSFITDDLMRRNASVTIMKSDPKRVYEYIENNHYNYLLKELPADVDERYKFDPIYGLSKMIEEKECKIDAEYYNYFKKNVEVNYRTLRDMIRYILTEEEKEKIGYNVSMTNETKGFICLKANLNLQKGINEIFERNRNRRYSMNTEDDDIDE